MTRILILFLILAAALGESFAEDHEVVGFLRHVDPPVSLRMADGQFVQLRMSDEGRLLHTSDAVRVQGNGKILIYYVDGTKREMRASKEWQLVAPESGPKVTKSEPKPVSETDIRRALNEFTLLGGVERSAPSSLCPADGSAVRAENLVLHWVPRNRSIVLTLSWGEQVRWHQRIQNGASGTLVSENARTVLEVLKNNDGGEVEFRVQDENGSEAASTFYLLSHEEEAKVESQLAPWQHTTDPLMKALGMASVFSSQKLYEEAAEQYHLALQQSPLSLTLQMAAREADLRAGRSEQSRAAR